MLNQYLFNWNTGPTSHEVGTYSGRRKTSQRQKRSRVNVGTQTEEVYFTDLRRSNMNGDEEFYEGQEDVFTRLAHTEEVKIIWILNQSYLFVFKEIILKNENWDRSKTYKWVWILWDAKTWVISMFVRHGVQLPIPQCFLFVFSLRPIRRKYSKLPWLLPILWFCACMFVFLPHFPHLMLFNLFSSYCSF